MRLKRRLGDYGDCVDMREQVSRARRHVAAAVARGDSARAVTKLRGKVRAYEATAAAMDCSVGLGRRRRKRR
mgnify:FL=1